MEDEQLLEKISGQDPFLADALEGYRRFPEDDHEAALVRIKDKLNRRTTDRRRGFFYLRIAAGVAVFIIAGSIFWMVNDKYSYNNKTVAFEPSAIRAAESSEEISPITDNEEEQLAAVNLDRTENINEDTEGEITVLPKTKTDHLIAEGPTEKKASNLSDNADEKDEMNAPSPSVPIMDDVALTEEGKPEIPPLNAGQLVEKETKAEVKVAPAFTLDAMDAEFAADSMIVVMPEEPKYIVGTILAENNQPLTGVNVRALGTSMTTFTNDNGQFRLKWTPDIEKLEFYYLGYEKTVAEVRADESLHVTLNQVNNLELSEVVVTSEPAKTRTKTKKSFTKPFSAAPKGGFKKFKKYLKKNTKLLKSGQGEVLLRFTVHSDNTLSDIKVLRSSAKILEAEAVRILADGPLWENNTGRAQIVEYVVKFEK